MTTPTTETLLQDISERMQAMDTRMSEAAMRPLIEQCLNSLLGDEQYVRKMRFATPNDRKLVGTKYARHGLTVADIEFLFDLQENAKGRRMPSGDLHPGASEYLRNTFNAISEAHYIPQEEIREIDKTAIDNLFPRIPLGYFKAADRYFAKKGDYDRMPSYQAAMRAMDTAESGYGSQLVGAQYVGDLWEAARRESRIFSLISSFEMTAPTAYLPVEVDFPEMLFVSESTSPNASDYATVKTGSQRVQVDAKKFLFHQKWSNELDEDSLIPFIPFLRMQVMKALAHYSDSLVLNGDTTNAATGNINLDDADPADTKHYLAFDGIRHVGIVDNTNNQGNLGAAITLSALNAARARMYDETRFVDWGHPNDPRDLIYAADITTADQIALLPEVLTAEKYGPNATIFNGELASIFRHPLIGTPALSKTEADGKVSTTGSNNIKGQVVPFNRNGFKVGWRRRVKTTIEDLPGTDQTRLVYSMRLGFGRFSPSGAASGIEAADVIFNISL